MPSETAPAERQVILLERSLTVHGVDDDENMPTDTARKIAALAEPADEIDSLA
jgi:hypothetical protein